MLWSPGLIASANPLSHLPPFCNPPLPYRATPQSHSGLNHHLCHRNLLSVHWFNPWLLYPASCSLLLWFGRHQRMALVLGLPSKWEAFVELQLLASALYNPVKFSHLQHKPIDVRPLCLTASLPLHGSAYQMNKLNKSFKSIVKNKDILKCSH